MLAHKGHCTYCTTCVNLHYPHSRITRFEHIECQGSFIFISRIQRGEHRYKINTMRTIVLGWLKLL